VGVPDEVAEREACSVHELASRIYSREKSGQGFTSAIRVFLTLYYRNVATGAELRDVRNWAKYRTSAKTSHVERQNRCVVSH